MRQRSTSSLFLIELIIAILFFAICSAVCVQLFVSSYKISNESQYLSNATFEAETLLELYRNADGDMTALLEMTSAMEQDGSYICYSDTKGNYSDSAFNDSYTIIMTLSSSGEDIPLFTVSIYPPSYKEAIISLSTKIYVPIMVDDSSTN